MDNAGMVTAEAAVSTPNAISRHDPEKPVIAQFGGSQCQPQLAVRSDPDLGGTHEMQHYSVRQLRPVVS
jgi:hypothetical protein